MLGKGVRVQTIDSKYGLLITSLFSILHFASPFSRSWRLQTLSLSVSVCLHVSSLRVLLHFRLEVPPAYLIMYDSLPHIFKKWVCFTDFFFFKSESSLICYWWEKKINFFFNEKKKTLLVLHVEIYLFENRHTYAYTLTQAYTLCAEILFKYRECSYSK